jgi:hypothetical protein
VSRITFNPPSYTQDFNGIAVVEAPPANASHTQGFDANGVVEEAPPANASHTSSPGGAGRRLGAGGGFLARGLAESNRATNQSEANHPSRVAQSDRTNGFWYGFADSAVVIDPPTSGILFSFPGMIVVPPLSPITNDFIPRNPTGNYAEKILTQGGGPTQWGDDLYRTLASQLQEYASSGWDGVMWDWEVTASDHTTAGFNMLMAATKQAGLINYVTTTAVGPYLWNAPDTDATGIDWSYVDYFVPQMYGASGANYPPDELNRYYTYWKNGGGISPFTGVNFVSPPMSKFLWGLFVGTCGVADGWEGIGCVEWAYSPNR